MSVLARDSEAVSHLVAVQPIAAGSEVCEISCAEYERVVMCPAWTIGETLGPGRHRWLCPAPQFPALAYFVRTAPIHVSFDMSTMFVLPGSGQSIRVAASGTLQARCSDVNTLIAQVVALPTDALNEGMMRSASRSAERMLARILTRRVLKAGTAAAVTDPAELPGILAELLASNPLLGAVVGVEVMHIDQLVITDDDGTEEDLGSPSDMPTEKLAINQAKNPVTSERAITASGEIVSRSPGSAAFGLADELTHPDLRRDGAPGLGEPRGGEGEPATILGIGMSAIGTATYGKPAPLPAGFSPGTRVLVPSLKQSAIVRQLQRGYYELEVGNVGDTIWVPATGVIPE